MEKLIQLTNSIEYKNNFYLSVLEVITKRLKPTTTIIKVEIGHQTDSSKKQLWDIHCIDIKYNVSNRIHEPKAPFRKLNIYQNHPVLWNYQDKLYIKLKGYCKSISHLIGDIAIMHNREAGDWVNYSLIFPALNYLNSTKEVKIEIPKHLMNSYLLIFQKHNIQFTFTDDNYTGDTELSVLIFGNQEVISDFICFGQPYIVAKNFSEKLIYENHF